MVAKLPSRRISDGLVLERMRCGLLPLDPVRPIGGEPVPARVAISGLALDGLSLGGDGVASEIAGGGKRERVSSLVSAELSAGGDSGLDLRGPARVFAGVEDREDSLALKALSMLGDDDLETGGDHGLAS